MTNKMPYGERGLLAWRPCVVCVCVWWAEWPVKMVLCDHQDYEIWGHLFCIIFLFYICCFDLFMAAIVTMMCFCFYIQIEDLSQQAQVQVSCHEFQEALSLLRKVYRIWQVGTVRSINHNVGALKKAELLDVNVKTSAQSINTERASMSNTVCIFHCIRCLWTKKHNLYLLDFINSTTNHWCLCQAAEKFKAPQPAPAVPEAKAAAAEEEEEEEEEEVRLQVFHFNHFAEFLCSCFIDLDSKFLASLNCSFVTPLWLCTSP